MMRTGKIFGMIAMAVLVSLAASSCGTLHRYPHHHHHPHRHRTVIIAGQPAAGQGSDCVTFEECLAMAGPDFYGRIE